MTALCGRCGADTLVETNDGGVMCAIDGWPRPAEPPVEIVGILNTSKCTTPLICGTTSEPNELCPACDADFEAWREKKRYSQ